MVDIKELAAFFDNPEKAEQMIRAHTVGDEIRRDDGSTQKLEEFYLGHKRAYGRRLTHGVPHMLDILVIDLTAPTGPGWACSSSSPPPNLDDLERRMTEPPYVYRPGRRKAR